MKGCYKVFYSKCGKRIGSDVFDNYDDALNKALVSSNTLGYLCVVLVFNTEKGKWFKRCMIYPNE